MSRVSIRPEDHLSIETLPAAWYPFVITKYEEKRSSDGNSTNHWLFFKVTAGKYKNKEIRQSFNEQFMGPIIPVFQACGGKLDKTETVTLDPAALVEKTIDGYVEKVKKDNSNDYFNKISDYAPYSTRSKKVLEEKVD